MGILKLNGYKKILSLLFLIITRLFRNNKSRESLISILNMTTDNSLNRFLSLKFFSALFLFLMINNAWAGTPTRGTLTFGTTSQLVVNSTVNVSATDFFNYGIDIETSSTTSNRIITATHGSGAGISSNASDMALKLDDASSSAKWNWIKLKSNDGSEFKIASMDFVIVTGTGPHEITITGHKDGGAAQGTITQNYSHDGVVNLDFNSVGGFDDIDELRLTPTDSNAVFFMYFDDLVISDPVSSNNTPTANNFTYSSNIEASSKTFNWKTLSAATDSDGDTLTASIKTDGVKGYGNISGNNFTYRPRLGNSGSDTVTITISDGNGGTVDSIISVNGISKPSTSVSDANSNLRFLASQGFTEDTSTKSSHSGTYFNVASSDSNDKIALAQFSPESIWFTSSSNTGTKTFTLSANGTSLEVFDLSNVEIYKYSSGSVTSSHSYDISFTGYKENNSTVTTSGTTRSGALAWTTSPSFSNFTDITKIDVSVTANSSNFAYLGFKGFQVANAEVSASAAITSSTYNASTGNLVITGTNFSATAGASNDVVANKFTITGEGASTYTLTDTSNVEIDSSTQFTLTLSATDKEAVNIILNKNGTTSTSHTTYDLYASAGFIADSSSTSDTGANAITVSNVAVPTVTSSTYDASTATLVVTGTNFVKKSGSTNDVDVSTITVTGESGNTYTLTSTDVEITSATSFSITLNSIDKININGLLNKNGTTSDNGTTYNLAFADDWMTGTDSSLSIADTTSNAITVSNVSNPTVTSSTYDVSTATLVVTGTNFVKKSGSTNDVDVSTITITGESGNTYTLTSTDVEITSATSFSITLNSTDKINVNGLLNKNGTTSDDSTTYNLSVADNWIVGAASSVDIADTTSNAVTVSNVTSPTITSSTYNANTAVLVVTGTSFVKKTGSTNDVDVSTITITGEGGSTYTLTSSDVEITSETSFSVTLNSSDKTNVNGLLNKDGTSSDSSTTYNLAGADNWMTGAGASTDISDTTGNAITVSNVQVPTITSATYDVSTGVLVVTGTNFVKKTGVTNDIDVTKFTLTGQGSATRTLTTTNVEITSETSFSITLNSADKTAVDALLNKDGLSSVDSITYNLATAEDWLSGAASSSNIADLSGNSITVSNADNISPTISSISIPDSSMKIGDVVTATITVTSDSDDYTTGSGAITGTIGGFTLTGLSKINNTTYNASFTVTSGGTDVTSGSSIPVSFTLKDSVGNTSTSYTTAITQSSDLIDANKPTLSSVSISSNNTSSSKAKVGDIITLTFTSSETLSSTPIVNISGQSASVTNTSGNNYSATYTMQNSNTEGSVAFTIDFSDSAGNAGTQVTSVSDSSSVIFDKTAPTLTDGNISISGASGTSGAYKIGDTITATWNNTAGGDNNSDISSVTVDFSAFGGGSSVVASNSSGTYTATYTINSGSLDATNKNISITATDLTGNITTTADTTNASIDSQSPTLTDGNISISGASGTSGAYKVGDTITATWNNTAGGDNNSDISSVTVDFSAFGGGSSVAASNSSGTYTATFTITEDGGGSIDATNKNISFTVTDNAGNSITTADTSNATVDNDSLILTDGNISISGASGTSGTYKVGDTITATWNNTAGGDNNSDTVSSVTVDFSEFGGGSSVVASNSSGTYTATYTITSGSIDVTNKNISITGVDNAGNSTTTADTTNATIDTQDPVLSVGNITISGSTGNSGVFKIGDTLTLSWNNTAGGDNNSDTVSSVTANLSAFGGASNEVLTNSSETWSTTYSITSSSVEGSSLNASIIAVDNAGNSTTVSDTSNISIDSSIPTVVIATDKTSLKSGQTANITFTLSEDSTNFVVGDVSVVGGTLSALVKSGNVYTSTFTPTSGSTTNATIDINASKFTDISGNENSAAIQKVISIDTLIPTVTISSDKNSMILSETAVISFTLSKDSSDFIKSDISVSGASLSSFEQDSSNSKLYIATLIPDSSLTTSITIDVNASKFTDSVGNDNSVATQKTITVLPSVVTYVPSLNSTGVELDATLKLEFSENIQKGTGNIIIKKTSDDTVIETIDVTSANVVIENLPSSSVTKPTITITRSVSFDLNTSYYVTIDATALKDSENNNYAGISTKTVWAFTSIDNHAPTITSNSGNSSATISANENQTALIDIDATDVNSGQTLTYSLLGTDANSFDVDSSSGVITFKTAPNYETKNSYSITVKVSDNGGGNLSDTQDLTVNINNVNDEPLITIGTSMTTSEDTSKDLTFTYTDEDNNTVTAVEKTAPSHGTIFISTTTITYSPTANFNGSDSFVVTLSDGNGYSVDKTINVTVTAVDDNPTISTSLINQTQDEDGKGLVIELTTSDIDNNLGTTPATYTASSSDTNIAKAYIRDGKLIVVPVANANGAVTITVTTTVNGLSSSKSFVYTITSVNDRPTISNIGDISHDQTSSVITKTINFDIWDDVSITSLTANSSNTNLLPNSSITLSKTSETQASLTYSISANNAGDTTVEVLARDVENLTYKESFNISVKAANDAQCVENTNTALVFDSIKSNNVYQNSVTSNINLVNSIDSICSSNITWTTSDNSVIDSSGTVTQGSEDKTITVTGTIVKGEFTSSKVFLLTVPKGTITDSEAIAKLLFETIRESNLTKYQITSKLNLIDTILGKSITWTSSNDSVISPYSGYVTRTSSDESVTLTATIGSATKNFVLTVLQMQTSDEQKVAKDKNLLTIASLLDKNIDAYDIKYNLVKPLPSTAGNGSTITWASSNSSYITIDGDVIRDATSDKYVTLTATITNNGQSDTKEFIFRVLQNKIDNTQSSTFKNAVDTASGSAVTTTENGNDVTTQSSFDNSLLSAVEKVISQESVKSILEFVDKVVNVYLNTDGSSQSTLQNSNGQSSSMKVKSNGSSTNVDANGNIESTDNTSNGSIKLQLNTDGSVKHEVVNTSASTTTTATSTIEGSSVESDANGNVETISEIKQNGNLYKVVVSTDNEGKTTTKYITIDTSTGTEAESKNVVSPSTPYPSGNSATITQIGGELYISTTVPLDGQIVIE